ncbi:hypothetical protein Areg01_67350 [Actinoplanes regularis]|nr:hypothetical protein Areg01_67350 [Actinoplanes regularis]
MSRRIAEQPLAQAVLRHLADGHPDRDDPVGSFARTVLNGEASLRQAADFSWHSTALQTAVDDREAERRRMPSRERARFEQQAARLRELAPPDQFDEGAHSWV